MLNKLWLNKFKSALVLKEVESLDLLIKSMPEFDDLDEMQEAYYLMAQAKTFLESLRDEERHKMNKIKKNMEFIKSGITFNR